ncbi:MAG: hypothetical protein E7662_02335 [Ruminococcaceae bacterium]|nr:hypothetical protein [Oscillospiraceae bacterium]
MHYLLLIAVVILISLQNVLEKQYTVKEKQPDSLLFGGCTTLAALAFFVLTSGFRLQFDTALLPYAAAFGLSYAASLFGLVCALRCGSMAISSLVVSYSLLIPTLYGVIWLKDDIGIIAYIGIALLMLSIFLLNARKGEMTFSPKWLLWILIAFIGNGMCSTVQKMQQMRFDGAYKNEFMITALCIAAIILLVPAAVRRKGKLSGLKTCAVLALPCGLANGVVNLFVMLLTGTLPNAILFPGISAGGIVLSFVAAVCVYKEKLSAKQTAGYALGILSVILLNL